MRIRILDPLGWNEANPEFITIESASKPKGANSLGEFIYLDLKQGTTKDDAELLVKLLTKNLLDISSSDPHRNLFAKS